MREEVIIVGGSGRTRRKPTCPSGCPPYPFVNIQPLLIVGIKLGLQCLKKRVQCPLYYRDIQDELDFIEMVIISKCLLLEKDTRIKDCKWKRNLHWKVKVQGHCKHFTLCFFDFSGKVWTTLDRGEQNKTMHLTKILRRFDLTLTSNFHYHTQASLG